MCWTLEELYELAKSRRARGRIFLAEKKLAEGPEARKILALLRN